MKRQNLKTPIMISGIFFCTLLAAFTALNQMTSLEAPWLKPFRVKQDIEIPPVTGHWLRTAEDRGYVPASLELKDHKTAFGSSLANSPVITLADATSRLNSRTDSINILYIWTDDDRLRVVSITSFNKKTRQAAVVVIPLNTVINNGNVVKVSDNYMTLQEFYKEKGRDGLRDLLQKKFDIKITNFVHVNQTALQKISDIVGGLKVNGDEITMLEAFEQTEAGIRTDDREVVRAVADQILRPRMLLEVPNLVWIFTHDIVTNFTTEQMISLFHFSRRMDLANMRKASLPGYNYTAGKEQYLFVSEHTWKNLIYEITT